MPSDLRGAADLRGRRITDAGYRLTSNVGRWAGEADRIRPLMGGAFRGLVRLVAAAWCDRLPPAPRRRSGRTECAARRSDRR
jgi:hypothetical protein